MTTRRAIVLIAGVVTEIAVADVLGVGASTAPAGITTLSALFSSDTAGGSNLVLRKSATTTNGANLALAKANGSAAAPTAVASGDGVGGVLGYGYDGSANYIQCANLAFQADGAASAGIVPGRILFATMSAAGVLAERMRIDSSGNLLVGTAASLWSAAGSGVIELNGSSTVNLGLKVGNVAKGYLYHDGTQLALFNVANGPLVLGTNSAERMRIDASGYVYIGGTNAGGRLAIKSASINTALEFDTDAASGSILAYDRTASAFKQLNFRGSFFTFGVNDVEKLRIDAGGNVLVATSGLMCFGPNATWSAYLYVGGNGVGGWTRTASTASVVTTNGNLHLDAATDKIMYLNYYGGTGGIYFFNGAATERMRIDGSGNVGIGGAPGSRLHVFAAEGLRIQTDSAYVSFFNTAGTRRGYVQFSEASAIFNAESAVPMTFNVNGAERMRIDSNGNFLVGTTTSAYNAAGRGNIELNGSSNSIFVLKVGNVSKGYLYHDGTTLNVNNQANGPLSFSTNGVERGRFDATGAFNTSVQHNATGGQASTIGASASPSQTGGIMVQGDGTNAAFMSFHRPGAFATFFGIDTDNRLKIGGWSLGAISYGIMLDGGSSIGGLPLGSLITGSRVGPGSAIALGATLTFDGTNYLAALGPNGAVTNIQYGIWRSLGIVNANYGLWSRVA